MRLAIAVAFLLSSPRAEAATQYVAHCPDPTRPVRTVDPRRPWVCINPEETYRTGMACPRGYIAVTTTDKYDPFKCALREVYLQVPKGVCPQGHRPIPSADPTRDYECERAGSSFESGPGCPKGTRPVPTPGALTPFRCVAEGLQSSDPEPAAEPQFSGKRAKAKGAKPGKEGKCPKGTEKVPTEDPFAPVRCEPPAKDLERLNKGSFSRYRIPGQLSFLYPRRWHLTDAWRDDPPSVLVLLETERDGKPITLSITRQQKGSAAFEPMDSQVWREKNWRGAREQGQRKVGGLPALLLTVPRESSTAFVTVGDGYYVLSYSAPADLFDRYLPAFERLLDTVSMPSTPGGIR